MAFKLSFSNIAWAREDDLTVYGLMRKHNFRALEIAPTRIFPDSPYEHIDEAKKWLCKLKAEHGFSVCSMQSIWYGKTQSIFGDEEQRRLLVDYTARAIDFAVALECKNLVFGCPKNRNLPSGGRYSQAVEFFSELGELAYKKGTCIGMEANPPIYNTNFINDTRSALELIRDVSSAGFLLNLDVGTMLENREDVSLLAGKIPLLNHVHISRPCLKPIERDKIHARLRDILIDEGYEKFISVERSRGGEIADLENEMAYIEGIFL